MHTKQGYFFTLCIYLLNIKSEYILLTIEQARFIFKKIRTTKQTSLSRKTNGPCLMQNTVFVAFLDNSASDKSWRHDHDDRTLFRKKAQSHPLQIFFNTIWPGEQNCTGAGDILQAWTVMEMLPKFDVCKHLLSPFPFHPRFPKSCKLGTFEVSSIASLKIIYMYIVTVHSMHVYINNND